jgi:hypothetical protein
MSDLDERAERLLQLARPLHSPSAADSARVRRALAARFAADPGLLQAAAQSAGGGAAAGLGKLLAVFGIGSSLGFAAGLYAAGAFTPASPALVVAPPPALSVPVASAAVEAPARPEVPVEATGDEARPGVGVAPHGETVASARTARPSRLARAHERSSAPSGGDLKAELEGLRRAQELLHEGDAAWAIARLDELEQNSPSSALLEERLATRALAECVLGRDGDAPARAFAEKFPRSPHLERVRASCAKSSPARVPQGERTRSQTESPALRHE